MLLLPAEEEEEQSAPLELQYELGEQVEEQQEKRLEEQLEPEQLDGDQRREQPVAAQLDLV